MNEDVTQMKNLITLKFGPIWCSASGHSIRNIKQQLTNYLSLLNPWRRLFTEVMQLLSLFNKNCFEVLHRENSGCQWKISRFHCFFFIIRLKILSCYVSRSFQETTRDFYVSHFSLSRPILKPRFFLNSLISSPTKVHSFSWTFKGYFFSLLRFVFRITVVVERERLFCRSAKSLVMNTQNSGSYGFDGGLSDGT